MKATILITVLVCLPAAACSSTPPPDPEVLPTDVMVTAIDQKHMTGGRAVYVVDAPVAVARAVILDFGSQAEYRPMVLEANAVSDAAGSGTVKFRFTGMLGVNPVVTCSFTITEEDDGVVVIAYETTESTLTIRALAGSFRLRPLSGGRRCLVTQEFVVAALIMDKDRMLEELEIDARAIRDRIEQVAREQAMHKEG